MDIASTVGVSLQFAAVIFKALQTVDGVLKGKCSEPVVTMELLCGKVRKECETFVSENASDADACNIAKQGKAICNKLTATIAKMHPAEKNVKTLSRAVFRAMWSKDKLVELQRSLDNCMQALERLTLKRFEEDTGRALQHISQNNDAILDIARLYEQATKYRKVDRILNALAFEGFEKRHGEVHEAEAETFRWVLEYEEHSTTAKAPFSQWLVHGDGIFHVIGKPGSGKSTLMKYIVDEPRTADLLRLWADGTKHIQASCFFWKPGNALQKTRKGLIRTLLHGMLRANPDLAETLFSGVWGDLGVGAESQFLLRDQAIEDAWTRLVDGGGAAASLSDYRCCFFIDGLDEFGDRNDTIPRLVQELKKIVRGAGGRVKICVSSREYPEIVNGLAADDAHRILLQDLTENDIARFADGRLQDLCDEVPFESSDIQRLRREIVSGAQGVFLWVAIVLGIVETEAWKDTPVDDMLVMIREAQHDELDDFLRGVVSRVQKHNRKRVAVMFKYTVTKQHFSTKRIRWYSFLQEYDTDDNFAEQCKKVRPHLLTEESYTARLTSTRKWIKRSCEGLLDIVLDTDVSRDNGLTGIRNDDNHWSAALTHRSVHEFIIALLAGEWRDLVIGFSQAGAMVRMARAFASLPWADSPTTEWALCSYFIVQATYGSDSIDIMHENFAIALAAEQAVGQRTREADDRTTPLATECAAQTNCYEYIEWKNKLCPQELVGRDGLHCILHTDRDPRRCVPTVWQLLKSGASPMDSILSPMHGKFAIPFWIVFLSSGFQIGEDSVFTDILEMLLQAHRGPLPIWVWVDEKAVMELDDDLFSTRRGSLWPDTIPWSGERTASLADFVAATKMPRVPALQALIDEREPAEARAARAQRLVQDYAHISALVKQFKWTAHSVEKIGQLVTR